MTCSPPGLRDRLSAMMITIDGPAASGKSTVARALARRLGIEYLDTGAMYRSVALKALREGVPLDDEQRLGTVAEDTHVTFEHEGGDPIPTRVILNGEDVTLAIRTPEVNEVVSYVAKAAPVRSVMVSEQRRMAQGSNAVLEGRDTGTVVFPDAEVKVFLTASSEERALRRQVDLHASGVQADVAEVDASLTRRDVIDSSRAASPLEMADDATLIDTTSMTVEEVVDAIVTVGELG